MKKWMFFLILLLSCCEHLHNINESFVNAIHLQDINLTEEDVVKGNILNFYYTNNILYISDNVHKKVFALNSFNHIIFELGNIFDTSTNNQNQSQAWEPILEELQNQFKASGQFVQQKKTIENTHSSIQNAHKVNYPFTNIGKIGVDHIGNIYVVNTKNVNMSGESQVELLKFSPNGDFLYRIGEEGRDNPPFNATNIVIQNFYFGSDDGVWLKYLQDGQMKLRYYSRFGKNILYFSEELITPVIDGYLEQHNGDQKYAIEDIFPISNGRNILVVVDIYQETEDQLQLVKKELLTLNKKYVLTDMTEFDSKDVQIYGISDSNELYALGYRDQEGYFLEKYNLSGKRDFKSHFDPKINYYKRLYLGVNPDGGILGLFLKEKDLVFVSWATT